MKSTATPKCHHPERIHTRHRSIHRGKASFALPVRRRLSSSDAGRLLHPSGAGSHLLTEALFSCALRWGLGMRVLAATNDGQVPLLEGIAEYHAGPITAEHAGGCSIQILHILTAIKYSFLMILASLYSSRPGFDPCMSDLVRYPCLYVHHLAAMCMLSFVPTVIEHHGCRDGSYCLSFDQPLWYPSTLPHTAPAPNDQRGSTSRTFV